MRLPRLQHLRYGLAAAGLAVFTAACGQSEPDETPGGGNARDASVDSAPETAEPDPRLAALPAAYQVANLRNGRAQFAKCRSCHLLGEGRHTVGPNLYDLFARDVGAAEGFRYSRALTEADFQWTPERLDSWLADPKGFLPGNRMIFVGLRRPEDRRDVIAYLLVETAPGADE